MKILFSDIKPPGECGVSDHSRRLAAAFGAEVVSWSERGRVRPDETLLLQYEPTSWQAALGEVASLIDFLRHRDRTRTTVFFHELHRPAGLTPNALAHYLVDLVTLRLILPQAENIIVTAPNRADSLRALLRRWSLNSSISVCGVVSNVHANDGSVASPSYDERDIDVVLFIGATTGVLLRELKQALDAAHRTRPDLRVAVLGRRIPADGVRQYLDGLGTITDALDSHRVAELIGRARVALSAHNTGVSGRRGTIAAFLAAGTPVLGCRGVETGEPYACSDGVTLCDPPALGTCLVRQLAEPAARWSERSAAARRLYDALHAPKALAALLPVPR